MSSLPAVRVPMRLSRQEIALCLPSLKRIVAAQAHAKIAGRLTVPAAKIIFPDWKGDGGEFSPDLFSAFESARAKVKHLTGKTKRVRFDVFEIAALILSARATQTAVRHQHIKPRPRRHKAAAQRILRKLERYRQRAKRTFIRARGESDFKDASGRWRRLVRFIRLEFLFCTCQRRLLACPGIATIRKLRVREWMEGLKRELPELGRDVPPEKDLRALVRRALRSVRRSPDARGWGAEDRICDFVSRRCLQLGEQEPQQDIQNKL